MAHPPRTRMTRESKAQLIGVLVMLAIVIVGAIAVIMYPRQLGLPGLGATPAAMEATPAP